MRSIDFKQTVSLYCRHFPNQDSAQHVVILHGLFAASDNLLRLGKYLAPHFNVHMLDLRNHGQSPHVDEMTYASMASDVVRYMADAGISEAALIGHSMGGKTAMQVGLSYPDVVAGIIVGDIAPVNYSPGHNDILNGLAYLQQHPPLNRKEADEALAGFVSDLSVRQFLIKNLRSSPEGKGLNWRFNLEAITNNYTHILSAPTGTSFAKPVLFIAGANSDYIRPEHQEETLALFPTARLKIIDGTTHWLHAQKPDVFNAVCLRFLRALDAVDDR